MLQCDAVCCSVLDFFATEGAEDESSLPTAGVCVAVFCSVLQCSAVCCRVLHRHANFLQQRAQKMNLLSLVLVCVLQCVAVCCSVLQCVVSSGEFFCNGGRRR